MDENQTTPAKQSGSGPVMAIGIVVVIAVIGGAIWFSTNKGANKAATTQTQTQQEAAQPTQEPTAVASPSSEVTEEIAKAISVEAGGFYFKPNEIRVKKGQKVTISLTNVGGMHDFVIDAFNVKSQTINGGASTTVEFTPDKTGTFEFYCSIGNHRQMGMKGKLIVE